MSLRLTKKQLFNLNIKWSHIGLDKEEWWKYEKYWAEISLIPNLPEDFIKDFKNRVNWYYISQYQKLSEDFIRKFKKYVYWPYIFYYQKDLSENFILEFKDKAPWHWIYVCQPLAAGILDQLKPACQNKLKKVTV